MTIAATAPGKLVLVGEYAVLDGLPALVMAVDRRAVATVGPAGGNRSSLVLRSGATETREFDAAGPSGAPLVDAVIAAGPQAPWPAWSGSLDSTAFFAGPTKLGLGSSAAALTAWAGAWWAAAAPGGGLPAAATLISIHRAFQNGAGSGLDVAAARLGGVLEYRLDAQFVPHIGSVRLPNSVGFAGIFAGTSASTVDFIGRYKEWQRERPAEAASLFSAMEDVVTAAREAVAGNEGAGFTESMAAYGECLGRLGTALDVDLVTGGHRQIGRVARRFGVAYKVSGAGGGDLGIAASVDGDRLAEFCKAVGDAGFQVVDLPVASQGLVVEEQT